MTMTTEEKTFHADGETGIRIDRYLIRQFPDYSRSYFQRLIRKGRVCIGGKSCLSSRKIAAGEEITVSFADETYDLLPDHDIRLDIIHEDALIIVLNKPPGLVVHPAAGNYRGTLANALAAYPGFTMKGEAGDSMRSLRPGIVHRLDKDTSGVMVVARTEPAHAYLGRQFTKRTVEKIYLAIVCGRPKDTEAVIDAPIGRDPVNRQKMAVLGGGRKAETRFVVRQKCRSHALIEVHPRTGRTHQIRVHLSYIGLPVMGDATYGKSEDGVPVFSRQMLHAWKLGFMHPGTKKRVSFTAPVPDDLRTAWESVSGERCDIE